MTTETRTCQNCKQNFEIAPEDFAFYKKIDVPAPTWCPDCRNMRRLAWRNERVLYLRPCDLCNRQSFSIHHPESSLTVYCRECWFSDKWDPLNYGRNFNFSQPFFPQFAALLKSVPTLSVMLKKVENSEYCNEAEGIKDSFYAITSFFGERLLYTYWFGWGNDCVDAAFTLYSNVCYETQDMQQSFDCKHVYNSTHMTSSSFCFNCSDCTNCFMSCNLKHKSHMIRNKQYTPEEYAREMKKIGLGSYQTVEKLKEEFFAFIQKFPRKYAWISQSENCSGDYILQSVNTRDSYDVFKQENGRYLYDAGDAKDSMDATQAGIESELMFEGQSLGFVYRVFFSHQSWHASDAQYLNNCHDVQDIFGCVGLRNQQFCLLNKRYKKEEYQVLRDRIIAHMKKTGEYGEFFPVEMSFHAYNETIAEQWYPKIKDEVSGRGWRWQEHLPGKFDPPTITWDKVADTIAHVDKNITKEILACLKCGKNYRIVAPEFAFYKEHTIPIPRRCPDCRFYARFAMRNPRKLWHRTCTCAGAISANGLYQNVIEHFHGTAHCPNEFETPYAPDRPEIVYCEQCYQAEVV